MTRIESATVQRTGLGTCPDCNQKVSFTAEWCVHCGYRPKVKICPCAQDSGTARSYSWPWKPSGERMRRVRIATCDDCRGDGKVFDWTQ